MSCLVLVVLIPKTLAQVRAHLRDTSGYGGLLLGRALTCQERSWSAVFVREETRSQMMEALSGLAPVLEVESFYSPCVTLWHEGSARAAWSMNPGDFEMDVSVQVAGPGGEVSPAWSELLGVGPDVRNEEAFWRSLGLEWREFWGDARVVPSLWWASSTPCVVRGGEERVEFDSPPGLYWYEERAPVVLGGEVRAVLVNTGGLLDRMEVEAFRGASQVLVMGLELRGRSWSTRVQGAVLWEVLAPGLTMAPLSLASEEERAESERAWSGRRVELVVRMQGKADRVVVRASGPSSKEESLRLV